MAEPGSDEVQWCARPSAGADRGARTPAAGDAARPASSRTLMSRPMLMGFIPAAATLILCSQLPTALGADAPEGGVSVRAWWRRRIPEHGSRPPSSSARPCWSPSWVAQGTSAFPRGARRTHRRRPVQARSPVTRAQRSAPSRPASGDRLPGPPLVAARRAPRARHGDRARGASRSRRRSRARSLRGSKSWDADREFVSQGAANIAAGLTGGFPVGGSFSRSSLNRLAGARTAWSGAITGLIVLALLPTAFLLEGVPAAVLGAIRSSPQRSR